MNIKINGETIPTPSDYQLGMEDLSNVARNAKGELLIEKIATKQTIQLSWSVMKRDVYSQLLKQTAGTFFNVEYIDPAKNINAEKVMYLESQSAGALNFWNDSVTYRDVTMNFIER